MAISPRASTPLSILLFIALGLQVVSVLSVPVIKGIQLSNYNHVRFGVFGYCTHNTCSGVRIGYPESITSSDSSDFSLPSNARHSLTNLLIVHPIAAGFTLVLLMMSLISHMHGPANSPRYLLAMLIFCFPTFLLSLLAFLVDVLLFIPHIAWGGWIVLAATVIIAVASLILCTMRRSLSTRKAMRKRIFEHGDLEGPGAVGMTHMGGFTNEREVYLYDDEAKLANPSENTLPLHRDQSSAESSDYGADHRALAGAGAPPGADGLNRYQNATPNRYDTATPGARRVATQDGLAYQYPNNTTPASAPVAYDGYGYERRGSRPTTAASALSAATAATGVSAATGATAPPHSSYEPPVVIDDDEAARPTTMISTTTAVPGSAGSDRPRPAERNVPTPLVTRPPADYLAPRQNWHRDERVPRAPPAGYYDDVDPEYSEDVPPPRPHPHPRAPPQQYHYRQMPPPMSRHGSPYHGDPESPGGSLHSGFTSVSQRPVNPRYYQQFTGGAAGVPPLNMQSAAPLPHQPSAPPRVTAAEAALQGNPDFALPGAAPTRRKTMRQPGDQRAAAAALRNGDGPYSMIGR
ncbi:SUR7/PalI family-domain-containing protein [Dipodascopsis tothii]|uniref:SUR7/PalI family-domain-containing protein n=1 Tax=Dipodascopsis tothii TaxID=44089 RepID=UPI0034CF5F1D